MRRIAAFVELSRPYFLALTLLPYLLGVIAAWRERPVLDDSLLWWGLIIQLLVQLSTAYLNDYWDIPTDRINTRRTLLTGGSGVLASGLIPPRAALIAAGVCQGAAVVLSALAGIPPVGWLLLLVAIGTAICYSTPPLRLAWRGLGESATGVTAALLVPLWACALQTGSLSSDLLRVSPPLLLFVTAMMLGIAAPDMEADRQVNKRTLAVRVGEGRIAALYAGLVGAGYATALLVFPPLALIGALASLPLALWAWYGLQAIPAGGWRLLLMVLRTMLVPGVVLVGLILAALAG